MIFSGAAVAQQVPAAAEPGPQASEDTPGEILVTARQRAEDVQKVPESITVLTADKMAAAGIRDLRGAAALIPNFNLVDSQDAGTVTITLRGIGQVRNGDAPVAVVVDGVQLPSPDMIKQALYDVERVEVLKGPQGALYGRNAIGGAINITTVQPTNDFRGSLTADYRNGDDRRIMGSVSGPIVEDKLLFRIAGDYRKFDGVFENVTLNRKVDFAEDRNIRGRLLLKASDRLTLDLRGSYGKLGGGASYYIPLPPNDANNVTTPIQADILGTSHRDLRDASFKVDYEIGTVTATSISALSHSKVDLVEDLDWFPQSILGATQTRESNNFTQEIRLTSASNQRFRWTAGAYYLDGRKKIDTVVLISPDPTASRLPLSSYLPLPVTRTTEDQTVYAVYGQVNYDLTPDIELTGALRYDHDKRELTNRLTPQPDRQTSFEKWQPKLSIKYALSDTSTLYATASRGFRSGGFNPPNGVFPPIFRAETTDTVEVGSKNSFLDRTLTLNVSGFYTTFKNQQVFILRVADQGIVNVDKTRLYGLEAEAVARPLRGLELSGSLGLIHSDVKDFDGTSLYRGNSVPLTYGWSYQLAAQYTQPLSGTASLTGRVDYNGKGDNYWHIDNEDKQKPVHLVNARLTLAIDSVSVAIFAENLLKEKYTEEFFAQQFSAGLSDIRYPGAPRRYGVTGSVKF